MSEERVRFQGVSFTYDSLGTPLLEELSAHFPRGWTGVVGANGVGKSTVLKLACGLLTPDGGVVYRSGAALYCRQRTDSPPAGLSALLLSADGEARETIGLLGVLPEWPDRWRTLSHGERKRAQIAVALWRRPQVLAIDEPTNHLDLEAQAMVKASLASFGGVGLLVSHDRDLLDRLCSQCLFIDPPRALTRPGGVTRGTREAEAEHEYAVRQRDTAKRRFGRVSREAARRQAEASRARRQRSKRGLARNDRDGRDKIDLAIVTGKDGQAGRRARQLAGHLRRAESELENARVRKTYDTGIWVEACVSKRDALVRLPAATLPLGDRRRLKYPELCVSPTDRLAVTGPNGAGKSTLVRRLVARLGLPAERVTYVPQEIALDESRMVLARARGLGGEELGRMMTVVSRLGSRPERLLQSDAPSPGESRKLMLALGIARAPYAIIMDEPTNHMDLPSVRCLEAALEGCPCALVLVSHDMRFLARLARRWWRVGASTGSGQEFTLRVAAVGPPGE